MQEDHTKKLVFIAGGIGITPFRSMLQYLIDAKDRHLITMLYSNKFSSEIAYREIFDRAEKELGIKTIYALTDEPRPVPGSHQGFIDAALIMREVPDYRDRIFYISGPRSMVLTFKKTLREMGTPRTHIKVDYSPGLV